MTHTPWGASQTAKKLAPGIMEYATAGHGGIHLSPTMNALMPDALRDPAGWYEEDCEWAFVALVFPQVFASSEHDIPAMATRTVKSSYPDKWEAWTGEKVSAEESHIVAVREFNEAHTDDWLTIAAFKVGDQVGVWARLGGIYDGTPTRRFLVSTNEYDARQPLLCGLVIDLDRHVETDDEWKPLVTA